MNIEVSIMDSVEIIDPSITQSVDPVVVTNIVYDGPHDPVCSNSLIVGLDFCECRANKWTQGITRIPRVVQTSSIQAITINGPVTELIDFGKIIVAICNKEVVTYDKAQDKVMNIIDSCNFYGACVYANNFYKCTMQDKMIYVSEFSFISGRHSHSKSTGIPGECGPMVSLRRHYKKHYWTTIDISGIDLGTDLLGTYESRGISLNVAFKGFCDIMIVCNDNEYV